MIRRALALGLVLAATACGDAAPTLDLANARDVSLTLTLREKVSWRGQEPSKSVRVYLTGRARSEGDVEVLETSVEWVELRYVDSDGPTVEMSTDAFREDAPGADPLTLARRGLIEGLVARDVTLRFAAGSREEGGALLTVAGLAQALQEAGGELVAEHGLAAEMVDLAVGGLEPLLDDTAVAAGLRAGGLGPAAPEMRRKGAKLERVATFHVAGRGWIDVNLRGAVGRGRSDAPTVRLEGRVEGDPVFTGDAGDAPPAAIGEIRVDQIRVSAETELNNETLRPLRGNVTLELPHAAGPVVHRGTEFLMVVQE